MNKLYKKEAGSALILTIIILASFIFSTIALLRASGTSSMVSGNVAFKESSIRVADVGTNAAIRAVMPCGSPAVNPCGKATDTAYVIQSMQKPSYFLTPATWSTNTPNACTAPCQPVTIPIIAGTPLYSVKYIVDRLATDLTNDQDSEKVQSNSLGIIAKDTNPSSDYSEQGAATTLLSIPAVYYRVTVKVQGANNSEYISQSVVTVSK